MARIDVSTGTIQVSNLDFHYSADDFVNADSIDISDSRLNRAWVIHTCGTVQAIVFAEYYAYCEQDALDEAADRGKLDSLQVTEKELADYEVGRDSEGYPEYEGIINLGNAGEPFDSQNLEMFVVPADLFADNATVAPILADQQLDRVWEYLESARCAELYTDSTYRQTREDFDEVQYDGLRDAAELVRGLQS